MLFRERQFMSSFKPGDWIQCTYANGTKFVAQAVSETSVKEAGRVYPTTLDSDWVAWQPKVGEWVVIADDIIPNLYAVFQFNNHSKDRQILPFAFLQTLKDQS